MSLQAEGGVLTVSVDTQRLIDQVAEFVPPAGLGDFAPQNLDPVGNPPAFANPLTGDPALNNALLANAQGVAGVSAAGDGNAALTGGQLVVAASPLGGAGSLNADASIADTQAAAIGSDEATAGGFGSTSGDTSGAASGGSGGASGGIFGGASGGIAGVTNALSPAAIAGASPAGFAGALAGAAPGEFSGAGAASGPTGAVGGAVNPTLAGIGGDALSGNDALNAARLSRGLGAAVNQQGGNITLRLTPPELGTVRIQLNLQGNNVSAQFHAETDSARTLLNQQLSQLRQTLEGQGLNVERLGVQSLTNSTNTSGLQQQNDQQSQAEADGRSRGGTREDGSQDPGREDSDPRESNPFTDLLDQSDAA